MLNNCKLKILNEGMEPDGLMDAEEREYKGIIIIGIQPLGRSGQRPELSQVTGMALVRCILGKFLGVVCHCFPPTKEYE